MRLTHEIVTVHTRHKFVIARGGRSEYQTVAVTLSDSDGVTGQGEAAPSRYYGESVESVVVALEHMRPVIEGMDVWALEELEGRLDIALRHNASAKSAVSAAAHDLVARRLGIPVWRLLGLDRARAPMSSFTIAIAPDEATLRQRVQEAAQYPILKIKLGTDRDEAIVRAVREEAPNKVLRVDANAAWTTKHALHMVEVLMKYGVEFVEQPLPPQDLDGLRFVRERSALPIIADESCLVASDVARLAGVVDGVNLKLAKCGGIREAIRIVHAARAHGMLVMAGCMIETTLGIAAAAHFAPLLDCADLDGAALLSDDPFAGPSIDNGIIALSDEPGLGVTRRAQIPKAAKQSRSPDRDAAGMV